MSREEGTGANMPPRRAGSSRASRLMPHASMLVLGVVGLVALVWTGVLPLGPRGPGPPRPDDFVLPLLPGGDYRLSEHRGNVVVVNFWASWCVPCREEMPILETVTRSYRDRGVEVVGVAIQDDAASARSFVAALGITYPMGLDTRNEVAGRYQVFGLPTTVFVGRDGRIVREWAGPISERQITTLLDELTSRPMECGGLPTAVPQSPLPRGCAAASHRTP